jgi:hypothetical protein
MSRRHNETKQDKRRCCALTREEREEAVRDLNAAEAQRLVERVLRHQRRAHVTVAAVHQQQVLERAEVGHLIVGRARGLHSLATANAHTDVGRLNPVRVQQPQVHKFTR